jgi:hypothetical protein
MDSAGPGLDEGLEGKQTGSLLESVESVTSCAFLSDIVGLLRGVSVSCRRYPLRNVQQPYPRGRILHPKVKIKPQHRVRFGPFNSHPALRSKSDLHLH